MTEPPPPPDNSQPPGDPQYPPPGSWGPPAGSDPWAAPRPRPYAPGPYPPPGPSGFPQPAPGLGLTGRLGARLLRRPEPRFGVSLAAVGVVLIIGGMLVWSGGYLAAGLNLNIDFQGDGSLTAHGQSRRFFGAILFLLLTVAGYTLVVVRRRGPLATAGAVAAAVGVPLMIIFLSFDINATFRGGFPFSIDAVYLVSILAWLISYFAVPGARGRSFYLGLAAVGFAAYIGFKASGNAVLERALGSVSNGGLVPGGSTDSLAATGLILGLAYYGIAAFLDRRGRSGAAVAMVYAGFVTTLSGVIGAIPSFETIGMGVLLIVLGAGLSWYGGYFGRRFTTWVWMAALLVGIGLIVGKLIPNSYAGAGITLIVLGVVVAIVAHAVATAAREAPDIVEELAAQAPAPVR
jgi:hypothetical protein